MIAAPDYTFDDSREFHDAFTLRNWIEFWRRVVDNHRRLPMELAHHVFNENGVKSVFTS